MLSKETIDFLLSILANTVIQLHAPIGDILIAKKAHDELTELGKVTTCDSESPLINGASVESLAKSVVAIFTRLDNGLRRINFDENFESFEVDLEIPATTERRIANKFGKDKITPRRFVVTDITSGGPLYHTGEWDELNLFLTNSGADPFVGSVRFFR